MLISDGGRYSWSVDTYLRCVTLCFMITECRCPWKFILSFVRLFTDVNTDDCDSLYWAW
jgi:hypothetical protein